MRLCCPRQRVWETFVLVGLVLRRAIWAGEKKGLGDIDVVEHMQSEKRKARLEP